jgi:hypothetical protein
MGVVTTIAWTTIAAVTACGLTWVRAATAIARLRKETQEEVRYWQAESARAKARAAQLEKDIATWTAGCRQGRDDLVTVLPLIITALERPTGIRAAPEDANDPDNRSNG